MNVPALLAAFLLGAALGFLACWHDALGWLLHGYARMRGGQWYPVRQVCPGCGRPCHVMRRGPLAAGLCVACSSGSARARGAWTPWERDEGQEETSAREGAR